MIIRSQSSSTSLPGGNQVDGLPPASSLELSTRVAYFSASVKIDLEDIEVVVPKTHKKILDIGDDVKVEMKYPSLNAFVDRNMKDKPTMDDIFDLAATCVDKVYQGDEIYDSFTKKEALDFLGDMNNSQFEKVQGFFESMPKLEHTIEVINPKTKVVNETKLEGLAAFFA